MRFFLKKSLLSLLISCVLFLISCSLVFASTPPDFANSSLSMSSAVPADGTTAITVTVILKDTANQPLTSGDTVTLTNPYDSTAVISPSSTQLDGTGKAVFTITSKSPGTYKLTVTDTTLNAPLNGLGTVYFNPTSGQYTCTNPVPGSTPTLQSAVATGSGQVILTWSQASDPVSSYAIVFGTSSGNYQYGNTNVGGRGTTTFTVSSLANNTTYYFAVRAVDGCMSGNNSNELSATTATTTTPIPTAKPTIPVASLSATSTPIITSIPTQEPTTPASPLPNEVTIYPLPQTPTVVESSNTTQIISIIIGIIVLIILAGSIYWYFVIKRKNQSELSDENNPFIPPENQEDSTETEPQEENYPEAK